MSNTHDLIVIGSGVAGLHAALEGARRGLRVALFEEVMFGGLVLNVNHLSPGLAGLPGSGSDLAADLMTQAGDLGVTCIFEGAAGITQEGNGLRVMSRGGESHDAQAVIVASGARLRRLGVPGEADFIDRGVSQCADCDAPMFRGKAALVVGGGDSALQEVLVLADFAEPVHLVHRGSTFTARQDLVDRLRANGKVRVHMEAQVQSLHGEQGLSRAIIRQADGTLTGVDCHGFFAYVGLEPNTAFLPPAVARGPQGHVLVDEQLHSTLSGVYTIGAARAGYGGMLDDAVSDAKLALAAIAGRLKAA